MRNVGLNICFAFSVSNFFVMITVGTLLPNGIFFQDSIENFVRTKAKSVIENFVRNVNKVKKCYQMS